MSSEQKLLLLIGVVAFVTRLGFALLFPAPVLSDASDYQQLAQNLLSQHRFGIGSQPYSYRTPFYPLFLALVSALFGNGLFPVFVVQAVLGAGTALLAFKLGQLLSISRVGLIAGALVAIEPQLVIFSGVLLTETLFTFLLVAALFTTLWGLNSPKPLRFVSAGILWGLSALTRPVGLAYLVVVLAVRLIAQPRERGRFLARYALILSLSLITLAPWAIRNTLVQKQFVPLTTMGGVNFWIGDNPQSKGTYDFPKSDNPLIDPSLSEVARDRLGYQEGLKFIFSSPLSFLRNAGLKSALMINPLPDPYWAERTMPPWLKPIEIVYATLWFEALFVFAIASLVSSGRDHWELVGLLAATLLFFAISLAMRRFRVPMLPILAIFAAESLANWKTVRTAFQGKAQWRFAAILAFQVGVSVFALLAVENRYLQGLLRLFNRA